MTSPTITGPRTRPLPQNDPPDKKKKTSTAKADAKKPPQTKQPQVQQPPPSILRQDTFSTSPQSTSKSQQLLGNNLLLPQPMKMDFLEMARLRASARRPEALELPANPKEKKTVQGVPLPKDGALPSVAQSFVIDAAQKLGFSKEVATIATAEMARRSGNQLVIDLKSKTELITEKDFKSSVAEGVTANSYTFEPDQLATLKDANLAASLGLDSLDKLYAMQREVLPSLRDAAINGTDIDFDQVLKYVNDPATRDGMIAYYEAMRTTRELGHGKDSAFDALPLAQRKLDSALKALPDNSPLKPALQMMVSQMADAQKTLLAGTENAGKTPRAAIALMNNLANMPLGQLPDADVVAAMTDEISTQAFDQKVPDAQVNKLTAAIDIAYALRSGNVSPENREADKQRMLEYLQAAGPLGRPLKSMFDTVARQATVKPIELSQVEKSEDLLKNLETISTLSGNLKTAATALGIPGLPDALDTLKNAADNMAKGKTAEGTLAGLSAGPALVSGLLQLVALQPGLQDQVVKLLGGISGAFKLPTDLVWLFGNARKVAFGTDLDGKQISQTDRLKAAVDLADSGISVLSGLGAVTGSTATVFEIAAAPPLAIGLVQAKLMLWVMEELGTMMGNIAQGQLRDRFRLGDGDDKQFKQAFAQLERDALKDPMKRSDLVPGASKFLLTKLFKNPATAARFQAYASTHVRGGAETITALKNGQVPPIFRDSNGPGVTMKDGAALIATGKELQALAIEFIKAEVRDVKSILLRKSNPNPGRSYLTDTQRKELRRLSPNQ